MMAACWKCQQKIKVDEPWRHACPVDAAFAAAPVDDGQRLARCGACGTEWLVTDFMRNDFDQQFRARPEEPLDSFYCGCQNDDDPAEGEILPDLGDH